NPDEAEKFLHAEWLVTNGMGGYSSSSIFGMTTRKYHGILVAAFPPPFGRTIMFNHISEQLIFPDNQRFSLGCEELSDGTLHLEGMTLLKEFHLEGGMPIWIYEVNGCLIEKRITLIHLQNTVHITYKMLNQDGQARLLLQPSFNFRPHESEVNTPLGRPYTIKAIQNEFEITNSDLPPLRLKMEGKRHKFILENHRKSNIFFRFESKRGYESLGELWSPGYFKVDIDFNNSVTLIASTENWNIINAMNNQEVLNSEYERRNQLLYAAPIKARNGMGGELILAADQFIITPQGRIEDAARAHANGDEIRTIIAGYHWFTDWGRDTMIALEGLTLSTGRFHEARWILRTFVHYVKDGLIPNMFPEGKNEGLYHTADATLWFFHAIDRYYEITRDKETLSFLLPTLLDIFNAHVKGTRFGIGIDPQDGLLKQGAEGYQLTWMDAKVGDWVVTPRRGKPVEINALWYNALRLLENWIKDEKGEQASIVIKELADKVYHSFNERFWYAEGQYLYDVIDGEKGMDSSCRPNQLLAISLKHAVLEFSRWESVLKITKERLLTPFGLRSLAPECCDYKSRYDGDLRSRDAAYHQGTVWTWLIGPFIDAWIKCYPDDRIGSRRFLEGFENHLSDGGIGSINEIFDAVDPYTPRGCIAQAWSVAEVLRCWLKTAE
ncbi:MAG: amylo-alpha-1,6-glucosidase, partial [Parachlamydiaceae bacterium]|nr:amylo-alpha-1,6-glucosidase [Parachlamydiaceae bacterium]